MIKKNLVVVMSLVIGVNTHATELSIQQAELCPITQSKFLPISRVNESDVEKTKKDLVIELKRTSMLRAGLNAGITVVALYAIYKVFIEKEPEMYARRNSNDEGVFIPAVIMGRMDRVEDRMDDFVRATNPGWFTWQWMQNWAYTIGRGLTSMIATKGVFDAGDHVYQQVYHPGTAQWFIGSHTRLIELCNELQEYAQKYDTSLSASSAEMHACGFYAQEITNITNVLIKHCGCIIAFMELSIDSMPEKTYEQAEGKTLTLYLRFMINNFAQNIEGKINHQEAVVSSLAQFTSDFGRTMMSFNRIEKPMEM